ncbi:hypothetical protein ACFVHW_04035 [Streptomyces sp. NPDC127110]|uniref:hypothetical protein n=1 Tax=Streptomyces sp. NPDC127110 TaxID=3345362 RepID=UPI00363838F3
MSEHLAAEQDDGIRSEEDVESVAWVAARVAELYGRGTEHPLPAAPVLALGIFERVGSNWLSDSLRPFMPQHNEPLRQQLGRHHPLSPLNPAPGGLDARLDGLGRHHLAGALSDLYGRPRHLVKETNLFFATKAVLGLLPDSTALILTRAPVGIASSFARGGLWDRWRYAERYRQLAAAARSPRWQDFAPLLPLDDPEPAVALGRLIAVNALLLADGLTPGPGGCQRDCLAVPYEEHVADPAATLSAVTRHLGLTLPDRAPARSAGRPASADATFATTGHKDGLVAELDERTAELVSHHAALTVASAEEVLDAKTTKIASSWLAGDDLYEVRAPAPRKRPVTRTSQPVRSPEPGYRPITQVSWRNLLVSNFEMAELLNALHRAGAPNTRGGIHLLVCPMPHERGGRLHFDAGKQAWSVSPGYESHPAYWVTWAGAAAQAAWTGARLPTRAEARQATISAPPPANCDYIVGDASPVAEPGRGPGQIHHLVGNVQIWCGDGPDYADDRPMRRYMFGAAWNTPGTKEEILAVRSRRLLGSSRGIGVRLVRESGTGAHAGLGAWEIAERLNRWVRNLDGPARPWGELDRRLVTELTCGS